MSESKDEMIEVFCRSKKGKHGEIIYPTNSEYFHFWVKEKRA